MYLCTGNKQINIKCPASVLTRNVVHVGHEEEIALHCGMQYVLLMAKSVAHERVSSANSRVHTHTRNMYLFIINYLTLKLVSCFKPTIYRSMDGYQICASMFTSCTSCLCQLGFTDLIPTGESVVHAVCVGCCL